MRLQTEDKGGTDGVLDGHAMRQMNLRGGHPAFWEKLKKS